MKEPILDLLDQLDKISDKSWDSDQSKMHDDVLRRLDQYVLKNPKSLNLPIKNQHNIIFYIAKSWSYCYNFLKWFFERGADPYTINSDGENFVHKCLQDPLIDPSDIEVIIKNYPKLFFQKNNKGTSPTMLLCKLDAKLIKFFEVNDQEDLKNHLLENSDEILLGEDGRLFANDMKTSFGYIFEELKTKYSNIDEWIKDKEVKLTKDQASQFNGDLSVVEQMQINIDSKAQEIQKLQDRLKVIEEELSQIRCQKDQLEDMIQNQQDIDRDEIFQEKLQEGLRIGKEKLAMQKDELRNKLDELLEKEAKLELDKSSLVRERERLSKEKIELEEEKIRFTESMDEASLESQELFREQKAEIEREMNALKYERDKLDEQKKAFIEMLKAFGDCGGEAKTLLCQIMGSSDDAVDSMESGS